MLCHILCLHFALISQIQVAPLHLAAEHGHYEIVESLLDRGAFPETEDGKMV